MIRVQSIAVGDATVTVVPDGRFRLDGGAMYGVVPRVVWARRTPPDDQNRITLGLNAMVIELGGARVLIDPGVGTRHDDTFRERFGIEQPPVVATSLAEVGMPPESIDFVVDTHLHWDHAGANTILDAAGVLQPQFPRARYVVQRREWDAATHPHERNRASYRDDDFRPLAATGHLRIVEGEVEVAPGIRVVPVGGHSDGMQLVRVDSAGATFLHLADLVPTRHHLEYPWVMGYDLYPVETLQAKKHWLPRAAQAGWIVGFVHDPEVPFGRVRLDRGRPVLAPV